MESAVIVDAVRSPMGRGKPGGSLSGVNPVDLLAQLLQALFERNEVDPAEVDDVVTGCVSQAGEQAGTPGRFAWLAAGLPENVPGVTIDRRCGSGQQAVEYAAFAIMAGAQDIVVACGVESMSRVPMGVARISVDPFEPAAYRYPPGEIGADPAKLNPAGGAIALGHPLGASGARIMTTLVHGLHPGEYGLQTMCENGGMANATVLQRL